MLDHICCFVKNSAVSNHFANQRACRDPKNFHSCRFWQDLFPTTEVFINKEELGNLIDRKEERKGRGVKSRRSRSLKCIALEERHECKTEKLTEPSGFFSHHFDLRFYFHLIQQSHIIIPSESVGHNVLHRSHSHSHSLSPRHGIERDQKLPSMVVDEVTSLHIVSILILFLTVSKYHNFLTAKNTEEWNLRNNWKLRSGF